MNCIHPDPIKAAYFYEPKDQLILGTKDYLLLLDFYLKRT
ncbi:MAG: hypothetical protein ACJA2S_002636 [Cyclobacteriaceae bacterium]|jgi:hypothetical protein